MMNKVDLAQSKTPLILGDKCKYMWHEEFNTVFATCHNSEGQVIGSQVRTLQNPVKQCSIGNQVFQPALSISELAMLFIKERTGSYICCDYYEAGSGYMFTNCGGYDVIIDSNKLNSTLSQDYLSQRA